MNETYNGWPVEVLENRWLKLWVAPQLGGRLIQLALADYPFLFVNPALAGYEPDATRLGPNGSWLNYGGEKIWPAPQGWDSGDQWPGPPDPVLDGGEYSCTPCQSVDNTNGFILESLVDRHTGLQIKRRIWLSENRSEVFVKVTFTNRSDYSRTWSIWPVCQVNIPESDSQPIGQVVCPVNPNSRFVDGYCVMHGLVNNPQFSLNTFGNLIVDYSYLVGKVGLDATAGWVAFNNKENGKVLLMRYDYQRDKQYPGNNSVHIWTTGRGLIYSRNRILTFSDDNTLNPSYVEMELLSPLVAILPGNHMEFEYRLQACTLPKESEIRAVNEVCVVVQSLQASHTGSDILIFGQYGVFSAGTIKLTLTNPTESGADTVLKEWSVSPEAGVVIEFAIPYETGFAECEMIVFLDYCDEVGRSCNRLDYSTIGIRQAHSIADPGIKKR
jgi:hypothetical protein